MTITGDALEQRRLLYQLIIHLYLIQILFISLTPLLLKNTILSFAWPLLFLIALVVSGFRSAGRMKRPVPFAFLAGVAAQLPGIISALVILSGVSRSITTPDAFDFTAQIWYGHFAPLFTLLPRVQFDGIPLYFLVTLLLPFITPFLPACGALLKSRQATVDQHSNQ